jgi:aminobenzoyl-glutamate transport protein
MTRASDVLHGPPRAEAKAEAKSPILERMLNGIERVGNKVPHPAVIFVALIVLVIVLSHLFALLGAGVTYERLDPDTHQMTTVTTYVRSLLTGDGIRFMYADVIGSFMSFNAVGVLIVAMLGVGVAETSGLVGALIHKLVLVAPKPAITYILVFVGILSSLAADAGYLVLIPLAATAFLALGRHPLAGLAASFAGVASVFSVNILIKPLDGILTGITNDAIHVVDPSRSIPLTANLWFSIASVFLMTVVVSIITEKVVEPRLGAYTGAKPESVEGKGMSKEESRGLRWALFATLGVLAVLLLLAVPPGAPLRSPETGALIGASPFMGGLIVGVTIILAAAGVGYGLGSGSMRKLNDFIGAMEKAVASMGGLIFLLFIISQFIAIFGYSNMATVAAVKVGDWLEHVGLGAIPLLVGFVIVVAVLDIIMTGAIPKWAIFAPIFVPLLMRLNVDPSATLAAYRVGDSPMNSVTPLNAYFALIVTFATKYQKDAGVGTVVALMMPYVVVVLPLWIVLLVLWQLVGLPWGL